MSDLSILSELQHQLALSRPGPPMTQLLAQSKLQEKFLQQLTDAAKIHNALKGDLNLASAGILLKRVNYPSEKRRTAVTAEQMRKAEKDKYVLAARG